MTLNELAQDLFAARRDEEAAKKKRIEAEEAIAALVETGENGTKTVPAGDGLKVTVKRALIYKANVDAIRAVEADALPLKPTPPVPAGWEFDPKLYEQLRQDDPAAFRRVSEFVEVKPAKVSVSLKLA